MTRRVLIATGALAAIGIGLVQQPSRYAGLPVAHGFLSAASAGAGAPAPSAGAAASVAPGAVLAFGSSAARPPPPAAGASEVAGAFLAAYVRFIHGRLSPDLLPHASPYLRRQAAGLRPRASPAIAPSGPNPRLTSLRLRAVGRRRASVVAAIQDGPSTFRIVLELRRRRPRGWTVTGLQEVG